ARRRGLRDGAVRGVPLRQARPHDHRRRGPARGRSRPRDRPGRRAECGRPGAGLRVPRRPRRRRKGVGARRQGGGGARHLGRLRRRIVVVKVAYYSPLPPSRSGIADYSRLLLPALRERVDVVVAERGKRAPDADVALYHLGNEPEAHDWIVDALRKRPGVVVMHEYVLHHLVAGVTIGRGDGRGYLNMNKRIPQLLQASAAFRDRQPGARLLLVGSAGERFDVGRRLERLGLTEGVARLDYVPEERLWSLMAACDVLVNLRYPTMGETSGSVIRALSLGKPLLVSDVGWFGELPDDAVLKIPVDELEVPTLTAALGFAAEHGATLGANARAYVRREHDLDRVADAYVEALEVAAGGDAVDDAVLWRIAEAAAEVGLGDASVLARAARESGILS